LKQPAIQSGYLVLVDLSGYTPFMASSELDHAQSILNGLLNLLRSRLTPTLTLAEVEGDALFLYAPGYRLTRGETLLELIESTYAAFRDRKRTMRRAIVCPCQACQMVETLDLKFVTHCGDYVLQSFTGGAKPVGSSVNLAHRLLKNRVTETTGWSAYALFTQAALDRMDVHPEGLHTDCVEYEHLGECGICAVDLERRYEEMNSARTAFLSRADADYTLERVLPVSPPQLWEMLHEPDKRMEWEIGADWGKPERPRGRMGPGTHNHCANSNFIEEVVDWRPFDYYTVRLERGVFRFRITGELQPEGESTALRMSIRMEGAGMGGLRSAFCRFFARRLVRLPARIDRLNQVLSSDERNVHVPAAAGNATPV
jgi:hypothetical protein